jgi:PKHD-type hydroxylase
MPLHIPKILSPDTVAQLLEQLSSADWQDGKLTAGSQAAQTKNNRQLDENSPLAAQLRQQVLQALSDNATFFSSSLPKHIYPPLFNRYTGEHNAFGNHVDNAIRTHAATAQHIRTDLSFTLFLSDPASYTGGELIIEDGYPTQSIKLPAGDLIVYPSYVLHRVEPVTQGVRYACVSWVQSMVRESQHRTVLHEMDCVIASLRRQYGDSEEAIMLTQNYHNLLRMWATV